jgi:hypothetical protein
MNCISLRELLRSFYFEKSIVRSLQETFLRGTHYYVRILVCRKEIFSGQCAGPASPQLSPVTEETETVRIDQFMVPLETMVKRPSAGLVKATSSTVESRCDAS